MWHRRRGREDETARVICARPEKSRDNAGDEPLSTIQMKADRVLLLSST